MGAHPKFLLPPFAILPTPPFHPTPLPTLQNPTPLQPTPPPSPPPRVLPSLLHPQTPTSNSMRGRMMNEQTAILSCCSPTLRSLLSAAPSFSSLAGGSLAARMTNGDHSGVAVWYLASQWTGSPGPSGLRQLLSLALSRRGPWGPPLCLDGKEEGGLAWKQGWGLYLTNDAVNQGPEEAVKRGTTGEANTPWLHASGFRRQWQCRGLLGWLRGVTLLQRNKTQLQGRASDTSMCHHPTTTTVRRRERAGGVDFSICHCLTPSPVQTGEKKRMS
ncbi:hypothetical protein Q8A73_012347 [Channa argus]|nr:hypothetical protein Q8A73_012347 [Channa argus]